MLGAHSPLSSVELMHSDAVIEAGFETPILLAEAAARQMFNHYATPQSRQGRRERGYMCTWAPDEG